MSKIIVSVLFLLALARLSNTLLLPSATNLLNQKQAKISFRGITEPRKALELNSNILGDPSSLESCLTEGVCQAAVEIASNNQEHFGMIQGFAVILAIVAFCIRLLVGNGPRNI
jgi:hypothetical protein